MIQKQNCPAKGRKFEQVGRSGSKNKTALLRRLKSCSFVSATNLTAASIRTKCQVQVQESGGEVGMICSGWKAVLLGIANVKILHSFSCSSGCLRRSSFWERDFP